MATQSLVSSVGYAAVFNNTDFYGHVIAPGAFTDTLTKHIAAGIDAGDVCGAQRVSIGRRPAADRRVEVDVGGQQGPSSSKGRSAPSIPTTADASSACCATRRSPALASPSRCRRAATSRARRKASPSASSTSWSCIPFDLVRDPANRFRAGPVSQFADGPETGHEERRCQDSDGCGRCLHEDAPAVAGWFQ